MKVYVRFRSGTDIEENGKLVFKRPGDWGQIGKELARRLHDAGKIEILNPEWRRDVLDMAGCGALVRGPKAAAISESLRGAYGGLETATGDDLALPWPRTLLWDAAAPLRRELVPAGLRLLNKWEIAAPIPDYNRLACNVGTDDDRALTEAVIHDLRVPVYEVGAIFVRRCANTLALVEAWKAEPGDRALAFLRALYRVRPLILALPTVWLGGV